MFVAGLLLTSSLLTSGTLVARHDFPHAYPELTLDQTAQLVCLQVSLDEVDRHSPPEALADETLQAKVTFLWFIHAQWPKHGPGFREAVYKRAEELCDLPKWPPSAAEDETSR